ncbi:hypothetical protein DFJ43DRAFT_1054298 [Lentinula guzmanii]|uniref:Uncharacterized protein n=1 Tax=Lentinula guzmanii TaxID=2804957 RepID=A0AA38JTH3_9AGAR|nr:hypothetical protein DFJ43DRAFT_1054298 [Lentinula guzmanii]
MRCLIALLPLITLAVHVVATDHPGQSIPLNNVPSYPQPAHLSPSSSVSDAATLVDVDLERQQHPSAQRPCNACLQKALHTAGNIAKAPGKLLIASAAELDALVERHPKAVYSIAVCFAIGSAIYGAYRFYLKPEECEGCHVRRTGLSFPTCQPLDCKDVCDTTSHTEGPEIASSGAHAKRDVARLNYRRRLELD